VLPKAFNVRFGLSERAVVKECRAMPIVYTTQLLISSMIIAHHAYGLQRS